ncbi:MAG: hypothetical protein ACTH2H_10270 [Glutamicibacter sp.]
MANLPAGLMGASDPLPGSLLAAHSAGILPVIRFLDKRGTRHG